MYRTILYDLDGTVLDTIDLVVESLAHALRTHLGVVPDRPLLVAGVGTPLVQQMREHAERLVGSRDEALAQTLAETYRIHNRAAHDASVRAFPGTGEALDGLRALGVTLGIVTSKPVEMARRGLRICGLDHFELVVGSDSTTRHKPDPEPVHLALSRLGAEATSTLFVGDSPHDVMAGNAAGVRTAAVEWGQFPRAALEAVAPTHWLEAPDAVLRHASRG